MISTSVLIKAQFYDVDAMKIVWHGNYVRYLEEARSALLDHIGYNYEQMAESGFAWPIVDLRVKYVKSVTLLQEIKVIATLVEYENRLRISYRIVDAKNGDVFTKAETVQFPVSMTTGEVCLDCPLALTDAVRRLL
jgi:acyl-CoA thioester hydrolase